MTFVFITSAHSSNDSLFQSLSLSLSASDSSGSALGPLIPAAATRSCQIHTDSLWNGTYSTHQAASPSWIVPRRLSAGLSSKSRRKV